MWLVVPLSKHQTPDLAISALHDMAGNASSILFGWPFIFDLHSLLWWPNLSHLKYFPENLRGLNSLGLLFFKNSTFRLALSLVTNASLFVSSYVTMSLCRTSSSMSFYLIASIHGISSRDSIAIQKLSYSEGKGDSSTIIDSKSGGIVIPISSSSISSSSLAFDVNSLTYFAIVTPVLHSI